MREVENKDNDNDNNYFLKFDFFICHYTVKKIYIYIHTIRKSSLDKIYTFYY